MDTSFLYTLWQGILWPVLRICFFVSLGLVAANLIESLAWSRRITRLAAPLTRLAHLSSSTAAGFSLAFVSGVSANSLLAEAYGNGKIAKKELVLANLLNSLPRFFLHLPTVFFLTLPFIHGTAFTYVGLTFIASLLQTACVVGCGRLLLNKPAQAIEVKAQEEKQTDWGKWLPKMVKRLRRRLKRLLLFMLPIYIAFYLLAKYGIWASIKELIVQLPLLSHLPAESLTIIILHVTAEFSAGLAAASVIMAENSLSGQQIVLALMIGNLLATPVRALRHQLPYYSGIYPLRIAIELILASQILRASCIILVTIIYYSWV
ncbi:hypothetical protein [Desulfotalea psychrophila]|uniref:Hypothetical membrane protein n=1 Tax=Desulfotalea psychrophila (strain LSv54 / DSM 12343) TaxID=177439 RepID=Q6ART2_DESPS|nr:hypothetical protein [Desulfotalea psychrophila]CAG34943.1 hypothetical membrane protein [Desulfotalea psychrophila LSv54]